MQVLPRPDEDKKKRRGGRRYRKMKERYGVTELKKQVHVLLISFLILRNSSFGILY
jgi:hypothetical protein